MNDVKNAVINTGKNKTVLTITYWNELFSTQSSNYHVSFRSLDWSTPKCEMYTHPKAHTKVISTRLVSISVHLLV